jgi:hypothetical protein
MGEKAGIGRLRAKGRNYCTACELSRALIGAGAKTFQYDHEDQQRRDHEGEADRAGARARTRAWRERSRARRLPRRDTSTGLLLTAKLPLQQNITMHGKSQRYGTPVGAFEAHGVKTP